MKTDLLTFSSSGATVEFSIFAGILSAALSQHHLSGFEIAQLEFHPIHFEKMVLMNLLSGQQWRSRHREQTYGHRGGDWGEERKERVRCMERVTWKFTIPHVK